jgi:FlaA1/EpsC-like NDP-sugar epimerase
MTIPEAAHLVLHAASMGQGSEIFVLDMGVPIRIVDLARDLIRLSGLEEGRDIEIVFTGLRPGEKMHERLFGDEEHSERTTHEKILVCRNAEGGLGAAPWTKAHQEQLRWKVDRLLEAAGHGNTTEVLRLIKELVPDFQPRESPSSPIDVDLLLSAEKANP